MIIIDTNVISELMRKKPDERVVYWFSQQETQMLGTTSITLGEVLRGIECFKDHSKRKELKERFLQATQESFGGRIYTYDESAALVFGSLCAMRVAAGLRIDAVDIMISAVAHNLNASIATRNIKDFNQIGIPLINPWKA